jgi:ABC-type sugar transport system substrate-binding protein
MTLLRLLLVLLATAALAGCAAAAGAESGTGRVVVVADASVAPATARAAQRAAGPGAELRIPRTATEQLSVTHWFAARGYDVIGIGLSRRIAVDPVAARYPQVRFQLLAPQR